MPPAQPLVEVDKKVAQAFGHLFGDKLVNGRTLNVERTIGLLVAELGPEIEAVLAERRALLDSESPAQQKYAFPAWDTVFVDPVDGTARTFRQIVQGLIDNFLGKQTPLAWRLNENHPIPQEAHPLLNPGLELTGPWHPLDMAIKQINADVSAIMGPDDEDAAPPDYVPYGSPMEEVGLFASRRNEHLLLSGAITEYVTAKKGERRLYRIEKPYHKWPTSFHRVPGIHLRTPHVRVNGKPAPSIIVDYVIHALNDFEALRRKGHLLYFYQPKVQTPREAAVVAKILWRLEQLLGAEKPGTLIKIKALYEEANAGRFLPVIMWMWRHWLIGTNVGRWDYTASLIEIWKDERVLPDPQNGPTMGMTSPHMMVYQKYNALLNLMAGLKDGELTNAGAIGGMAAVMLYSAGDPYGRARHNPVTLRAMWLDKLRERLIGLIFVVEGPKPAKVTLEEALAGKHGGRLYDLYRQSWVASPEKQYVEAGNIPLRTPLERLQAMLDAPEEWVEADGKRVAPSVRSGLTEQERRLLSSLGLVDSQGKITPWVISKAELDTPEKLLSPQLWGRDLWDALYRVGEGDVTAENIQHAFYMAANYGFQVLNGNLAAAIDDYVAFPGRLVRFMNDLATYRIFVSWLWTLVRRGATITRDGWLMGPAQTEDGVLPAKRVLEVKAGTRFGPELFHKIWELHNQWTRAFFEDYDRLAALRLIAAALLAGAGQSAQEGRTAALEKLVQTANTMMLRGAPTRRVAEALAAQLGSPQLAAEAERLLSLTGSLQNVLSKTYGAYPTYRRELSLEEAAERAAALLGQHPEAVRAEIEAAAPRFDRSKAPAIMDILRRQLLCPLYVQHSARVLFSVADKSDEERSKILDAVFYMDSEGKPLFRDEGGEPSRRKLVEALSRGALPLQALETHDYIYDFYEK